MKMSAARRATNARVAGERLRIGEIWVDRLTFDEAIDAIDALVREKCGGKVFTPNVDHLVLAEQNALFKEAYDAVDLSFADGMPLVWASRLMGIELPAKISGADLIRPLMKRAKSRKWRVFLLGGAPGVAAKAAEVLVAESGATIAGISSPMVGSDGSCAEDALEEVRAARPDLLLAALGSPKQEIWIHRNAAAFGPVVAVGIGAGFDFIAGTAKRAPPWMSDAGVEWLFRLAHEPRRLWRRYILMDTRFPLIVLRTLRRPRHEWHRERATASAASGTPGP